MSAAKKSDNNFYNTSSKDFIPVACHYDQNTLITKNGELLQIIQINGINSEKISKNLFNLREVVRKSISSSVHGSKYAFWIHTIRRKTNLDDNADYYNEFSANVHDIWRRKNYWHDKFVNRLYITIVHAAPTLRLKNLNSFINSLSTKAIASFQDKFFSQAVVELTETVDSMLSVLDDYGAQKLGIRIEGDECFSDMMFLYRRIMQLNEDACELPITDISTALASHQYAVGSDKIEVIGEDNKKFAAIMSIKEYQEVSADSLDRFLQIPVEMIATEVFYFVNKKEVVKIFEDQNYILNVSDDKELKHLKGIDKIFNEESENIRFCHQQISFMVIGEDLKALDKQVSQASSALSEIGIVHVREDINLEKTFWAQLPANFSYLARMKPTIVDNTAALASLHNFPTGHQYNRWGRALTLLRTERGTPYFMNFHDKTGKGTTCIFGDKKSGRTTLFNFLLSEADKYQPCILYVTDDKDSEIYIKARGGKWIEDQKNIINPLLCADTPKNREYIFEFFKIISRHYFDPLSEDELEQLRAISDNVFSTPINKRQLSTMLKKKKNATYQELIKSRLNLFMAEGMYCDIFEREENLNFNEEKIVACNLEFLDDELYTVNNYPKEKKYIEQFEYDLNTMRAVKAGIVLAMQNLIMPVDEIEPKILAVDNFTEIINLKYYQHLIHYFSEKMHEINGVSFLSINVDKMTELINDNFSFDWVDQINTSFILPSEISVKNYNKVLRMDSAEFKKLSSMSSELNLFLIRQDQKTIASELSIGGHLGLIKILCSSDVERSMYQEIIAEHESANTADWVKILYDKLENIIL